MMSRPGRNLGPFHPERVEIFPEGLDVRRGKFVDANVLFRRFVDYSIVDIGEIEDMRYLIAFEFQIAPQDVAEDERAKVTDVCKIPNRRTADVHPDTPFLERMKLLGLSG
jgi:hypothetical protein